MSSSRIKPVRHNAPKLAASAIVGALMIHMPLREDIYFYKTSRAKQAEQNKQLVAVPFE